MAKGVRILEENSDQPILESSYGDRVGYGSLGAIFLVTGGVALAALVLGYQRYPHLFGFNEGTIVLILVTPGLLWTGWWLILSGFWPKQIAVDRWTQDIRVRILKPFPVTWPRSFGIDFDEVEAVETLHWGAGPYGGKSWDVSLVLSGSKNVAAFRCHSASELAQAAGSLSRIMGNKVVRNRR